ncbi:MAG: class I SAM-dependent methyltransferase [Planctomycetota bacterium]|jgi:SAM-dependent methyltransferase
MSDSVSDAAYWAERYREGTDRWDLGEPARVLCDLLESQWAPPRGRVAFPGCGAGHDLRYWLDKGYDATGFDFAIQPDDLPVEALDVFELGDRYPDRFDVVVEYTCYCAIDPARRADYTASLRAALKPGGILVALLFPVGEKEGGPPFAVAESEITGVLGHGFDLMHCETPAKSAEGREGRERLAIYRRLT